MNGAPGTTSLRLSKENGETFVPGEKPTETQGHSVMLSLAEPWNMDSKQPSGAIEQQHLTF